MTKLLVATPAYGEMFYTPYVSSLVRLQRLATRNKWDLRFASISYADVVESRNFLLTHWYDKTDATHVLFIDADMGYPPELVVEMVQLRKPVVGVVAPKRHVDLNRLTNLAAKGEKAERAIASSHQFLVRPLRQGGKPRIVDGFMEVAGCGAGILLIERSCIRAMLAKMPELSDTGAKTSAPVAKTLDRLIRAFDPLTLDGARLSEDFSFCHRWRNICGGEIWANISHEITHVGLHHFTGRYQDAMPRGPRITVSTAPLAAPIETAPDKPRIVGTTRVAMKEGTARTGATPTSRTATTPAGLTPATPPRRPNGG
jgi:hypothetical protein